MRDLKFRIWTGDKYKQYPQEHADKNRCAHSPCMYGNVGSFGVFGFKQREDYILEQYIGLKDVNGVEIYEGDIVKTIYDQEYPIGTVGYDSLTCAYRIQVGKTSVPIITYRMSNGEFVGHITVVDKVIGNIHENPELLK